MAKKIRSAAEPAAVAPAAAPSQEWGEAVPSFIARSPSLRWLAAMSGEQRLTVGLCAFAVLLFVPWLGATGFWDPWEPHYGEVAREMIARGDYLHPWWESTWFFSKPALDLWLMAAGMLVAGTNGPERYIGPYTEWCVRLPFAAICALGAVLLFVAAGRLVGRRPALLASVALLTSPLVALQGRQAVPDPIFVGLLTASMSCLLIVLFDEDAPGPSRRDGWLAAFYVFVGLGTLSKGILAFALPGATALVYCTATGEWHRLRRLRMLTGALVVLLIAGPWYGTMFGFDGRDEEGKTFFERFIIHDHFKRLVTGVYTTTPGGTFIYFIEQLGFDCFPWVFAFPGAASIAASASARPRDRRERAVLFLLLWLLIGFAVFAFSATKFHHYAFPVIPPLLVLSALFVERLLRDGLRPHLGLVLCGGLLYGLVARDLAMTPKHLTDLFVFNYDRPYPDRETDPRQIFALLFYAAPAVALSPWLFDRLAQGWRALLALPGKAARRKLLAEVNARLDGAPLAEEEAAQDRLVVVASLCALAVAFAVFLGWFHWRNLSPHWTQRDLFWEYTHQAAPDEPIGAYLMNWRGETFYSKNTVRQMKDGNMLQVFLAEPGTRKWILVEQARLGALRQAAGPSVRIKVVESRNNKFVLTTAETTPSASAPGSPKPKSPEQPAQPGVFGAPP